MLIERTVLSRVLDQKKFDPLEYENLLLDGIACPDIFDTDRLFLEKFVEINHMSFNSSGLKNLRNLPSLSKLIKLELSDNKIQDEIKKLQPLENLVHLDLLGNPLTELNNYQDKIFKILPNLEILDGQDPDGNDVVTDEEDFNEEQEIDDYGDEQDLVAEGLLEEKDQADKSVDNDDENEDENEENEENKKSDQDEQDEQDSDPGTEEQDSDYGQEIKKKRKAQSSDDDMDSKELKRKKLIQEGDSSTDEDMPNIVNLGKRKAKAVKLSAKIEEQQRTKKQKQ